MKRRLENQLRFGFPWGFLLVMLTLGLPGNADTDMPTGWEFYSTTPELYQAGRATSESFKGQASAHLRSVAPVRGRAHALLLQKIDARNYRGQRLRMSGYVKAVEVKGWAGLWMRADSRTGEILAFDNMMDRPITGSTNQWQAYSIEIDIPDKATEIHFGGLLYGAGEIYLDQFEFQVAGKSQGASEVLKRLRSLPEEPQNLDFEG